jgi:signal transduction histidine kinase
MSTVLKQDPGRFLLTRVLPAAVLTAVGAAWSAREFRRSAEAARKLQELDAIRGRVEGVAHDFNNLLVAIRGYCELAQRKPRDPRLGEWLEEILKASDQASVLTRRLLDQA